MAKTVKTEAEIFKEEFKKKVRDEAKMLYRKNSGRSVRQT